MHKTECEQIKYKKNLKETVCSGTKYWGFKILKPRVLELAVVNHELDKNNESGKRPCMEND